MASTINASTSGAGGIITTADNSGVLQLQSGGITIATVNSTGLSVGSAQITTPTGSAPMYAARTWVAFNGTPSTPTILASGNVTSVTKLATGQWQINFTVAMPDANYATVLAMTPSVSNNGSDTFPINQTTTAVEVRHWEAGVPRDSSYISVVIFR